MYKHNILLSESYTNMQIPVHIHVHVHVPGG